MLILVLIHHPTREEGEEEGGGVVVEPVVKIKAFSCVNEAFQFISKKGSDQKIQRSQRSCVLGIKKRRKEKGGWERRGKNGKPQQCKKDHHG